MLKEPKWHIFNLRYYCKQSNNCSFKAKRRRIKAEMHYDPKRTTLEQTMKNLRLRSGDQMKQCLEL